MKFPAVLLMTALAVSATASAAGGIPTAESVLERSVAVSGGAAAFEKIKSLTMTGTVELVGHNISGPLSAYQQGDKMYTVIELPGLGKVEEGFDGETAWESNAIQGARIKEGAEKAISQRANRMNLLSSWKSYYTSVRNLGSEQLDGKPVWKLELKPKEGGVETFYFDQESGLLVRVTQTVPTALGDIPADARFSDYRQVGGVRLPFVLLQNAMSQQMKMQFEKIELNAKMPEDRFALPEAVKALVAKAGDRK